MGIIAFILLLAIIYLWYLYKKAANLTNKNYHAVNQNLLMLTFYSQLLYILMEQKKFKEDDYYDLVNSLWNVDGWAIPRYQDNTKKWGGICKALGIPYVEYANDSKDMISEKMVRVIANWLYHNRHTYQQYIEEAERVKKRSHEIDSKYEY